MLADPLGDALLSDLRRTIEKLEKLRDKASEINNYYLLEAVDSWRPVMYNIYSRMNTLVEDLYRNPYAAEFSACGLMNEIDSAIQRYHSNRYSYLSGYLTRLLLRIREYARQLCEENSI